MANVKKIICGTCYEKVGISNRIELGRQYCFSCSLCGTKTICRRKREKIS